MELVFESFEFLSYFICMGASVFSLAANKNAFLTIETINKRWTNIYWVSLFFLILTTIVLFFFRLQRMSGAKLVDLYTYIIPVFSDTHYGKIFILRLGLLALLAIILSITHKTRNVNKYYLLMFTLIVAIGYTFSAVAHAADYGSFSVPELVDYIHFLSTSIWGGTIIITLLMLYKNIPTELLQHKITLAVLVSKVSTICAYALLFVLITGFYKLQAVLSNGLPLGSTNYGQLLSIKLIFVAALVSLGAMNRYVSLPNIARWAAKASNASYQPIQFFIYVLTAQTIILFIILAVTSSLINSPPMQ